MITDGCFALCSTRIFLSGRLISCGARLVYTVAISCICLVLRTDPGCPRLKIRAQLLHLLAKKRPRGKLWVLATPSSGSRLLCFRTAIATRTQGRRNLSRVLHLRLRPFHIAFLSPTRLQGLSLSSALKARTCFSAERGVAPLRLLILDSRPGPFFCRQRSTDDIHSFIHIDYLVILHSYCDNLSTVLGRLVRSLPEP